MAHDPKAGQDPQALLEMQELAGIRPWRPGLEEAGSAAQMLKGLQTDQAQQLLDRATIIDKKIEELHGLTSDLLDYMNKLKVLPGQLDEANQYADRVDVYMAYASEQSGSLLTVVRKVRASL
jgi:soluble cytochrome b562